MSLLDTIRGWFKPNADEPKAEEPVEPPKPEEPRLPDGTDSESGGPRNQVR